LFRKQILIEYSGFCKRLQFFLSPKNSQPQAAA
jgi:hypothetical protein